MSPSEAPPADPALHCLGCAARNSCLVGQLPRIQQDRLGPLILEQRFRKGEVLQAEGTEVEVVRTIKLGTVMLTRLGPDRVMRPVALVGRGHLMGLMGLLGQTTQVGAQALSPGRICEVPVAAMLSALDKDPALQDALHQQISRTIARLADWGQTMRLRGLHRQLVATLMLLAHEQGTRMVRIPSHVALSELLRTTRESVARTLRQLEDQGHLQRNDRWHATLAPGHERVFTEDGTVPS
ncbi:Crp/Fnr family transcriptional regulator [Hydrogenophaga luteola]|uniref:Crp/Fnr family transcriptional regulator n=1 Tax=Hydrogenophaga luteola TaxID=1591122 RepID=A0ABV7W7P4_9BURK